MEGDNREEIVEDSDVDAETEEQPVVEAVGNPQPRLNPLVEDPQIITVSYTHLTLPTKRIV